MARRVFFSFHYQPDIFRVQVVRQSALTHNLDDHDSFFDGALWEKARSTSPDSLKRIIQEGMHGSSVVCVLAGEQTWARGWVRYEIARAVVENKGLVTVHINGIECAKAKRTSPRGNNPLDYIAVGEREGRYYLCEFWQGKWRWYPFYTLPVEVPRYLPKPGIRQLNQLSKGTREYDYAQQNGYKNLAGWVEDAAMGVGRAL